MILVLAHSCPRTLSHVRHVLMLQTIYSGAIRGPDEASGRWHGRAAVVFRPDRGDAGRAGGPVHQLCQWGWTSRKSEEGHQQIEIRNATDGCATWDHTASTTAHALEAPGGMMHSGFGGTQQQWYGVGGA